MFTVQFDAIVFDEATEETHTGWIDPARPLELRELHTDVPEFEFATYEEAERKALSFLSEPEEIEKPGYTRFEEEQPSTYNHETGESYTYGADIEEK